MMISETVAEDLRQALEKLSEADQRRVVEFARTLSPPPPPGVPGIELRSLLGLFTAEDLTQMKAAIDEDCGNVDPADW